MKRFADVALPVALDREFTYRIPPALEHSACIGVRAVVPFGRKYAVGLIVSLPEETSLSHLKPIHDIIDPLPIMSLELLALCRWIARYYFSPLGEVLKAALPQGFSPSSKRRVRPTPQLTTAAIETIRAHGPRRADLLSLVLQHGEVLSTELQRRTDLKDINGILNELARDGLIAVEEYLPRSIMKPRRIECIDLDQVSSDALRLALMNVPPRRKGARALLETILALADSPHRQPLLSDLLRQSGSSLATARAYAATGLIPLLRKELPRRQEFGTEQQTLDIVLNDSQRTALGALTGAMDRGEGEAFLLHGVTGSGKTQVYIEAIRYCLSKRKTAIVLVPEISLTPQMVRRFTSHFGESVVVVHSRMSPGERHDAWRLAYEGRSTIVIGPRSAIFAPLADLGLIVVDEEHEASYKQFDTSPRYHARDVAVMRAVHAKAVVLLGSATPSVESYFNALNGKYHLLSMPDRIDHVPMPVIGIVDMTVERKRAYAAVKEALPPDQRGRLKGFAQSTISALLHDKIQDRLGRKEGIILLQNRRGFAPFVECAECGYVEMCDNCNVTLTYHLARKHLRCHYCGLIRRPQTICPSCHGADIALRGIGTQKVEQELAALFPDATVLRMDLDSTSRRGSHDRILRTFGEGRADILLGTQMVAKGLDFARVTLVGVISADTQLLLPDFRSSERTFQLLTQVSGRAGRSVLRGEVVIQTHQPGHYTLLHVIDHDFKAFYEEELRSRQELAYPPFSRLALIETKGEGEAKVQREAERFGAALTRIGSPLTILGPAPAVISKINKNYRWHIIVKSRKEGDPSGSVLRQVLQDAVRDTGKRRPRDIRCTVDVDPIGIM